MIKQLSSEGFVPSAPLTAEPGNTAPAFKLDIVRSLHMRRRLAQGVALAVFLLIVAYALTRKPLYEAESLTYVEPLATKVMNDGSPGFYDPSRYDSYLDQQIQTAQRTDILAAAVAKLPDGVWRRPNESLPAAVSRLASALTVKRVGTSYQLSISATGTDAEGTAAVVNAVTDAYLEQGSKDEHAITDGRIQLLTEERLRIQKELTQAQQEQNSLSATLGVANPVSDSGNPYDEQLGGTRTQLNTAREAHNLAAAELSSMTADGGLHAPGMAAAADQLIAGDPGLGSMKSTINQRRGLLQSQMAGLTPSNPVYKQDQDEIAALDRDLDAMTTQLRNKAESSVQDKLRQELQRTGDVEARLNGQLAHETALATGAAPKLQRASELAADITRLQASFAGVDDSLRALHLETHGPGLAHLSVAATVPIAPAASRKKLMLLLALPLALLAGMGAAVAAQKRDPRIYVPGDVKKTLGFLPMGVMPVRAEVSGVVMEEYLLRLAAGIERAYRTTGARTFVFSAVSAGTDIADLVVALRGKLAELGFGAFNTDVEGVLRPRLGREVEVGLASTGGEGFAATQLERLKQNNDLLLIEAQPLLLSAETEYTAASADVVILIVEGGESMCKELKDAANLLQRLNAQGIAVVIQNLALANAEPQFRTTIEELDKNAYRLQPRVLPASAPTDSSRTNAEQASLSDERRDAGAAQAVGSLDLEGPPLRRNQFTEPRPRKVVPTAPARKEGIIDGKPVRLVENDAAREEKDSLVLAKINRMNRKKAAMVTGVANRTAHPARKAVMKRSLMNPTDEFEAPKKSFFERIFQRFHEPAVSILPEADIAEEAAPAAAASITHAPVPLTASHIANDEHAEAAVPGDIVFEESPQERRRSESYFQVEHTFAEANGLRQPEMQSTPAEQAAPWTEEHAEVPASTEGAPAEAFHAYARYEPYEETPASLESASISPQYEPAARYEPYMPYDVAPAAQHAWVDEPEEPEVDQAPESYTEHEAYAAPEEYAAQERHAEHETYAAPEAYAYAVPETYAVPKAYSAPEEYAAAETHTPHQAYAPPEAYRAPEEYAVEEVYVPIQDDAEPVAAAPFAQDAVEEMPSWAPPSLPPVEETIQASLKEESFEHPNVFAAMPEPLEAEVALPEPESIKREPAAEPLVALEPAPTMRQWEFRQGWTKREIALANAEAAASEAADEVPVPRRSSRPGLVSATGKRTLIRDTIAPAQSHTTAPLPSQVMPLAEETPRPGAPMRRWGMLSRFDRRFEPANPGAEGQPEMAAYAGSERGHGERTV